jgi:hypothetical protein
MSSMIAPSVLVYNLGATVAAGTNEEWGLFTAPVPMQIIGVQVTNGAALTGHASNYTTFSLRKGATVIASRAMTAGNNAVADTPFELTLSSNSDNTKVAVGDVVSFRKEDSGTGMALTAQASVAIFALVGAHRN